MPKLAGKEVGPIGFGLMSLTWRANPPTFEQSIQTMKTALSLGANAWNGGEFYGPPNRNSLHLLNEYFTKYPEDADKVVLSIKGGGQADGNPIPDGSKENVKRSIDESLKQLAGRKFLDLFECARVDPKIPIEETISYIAEYVKAGKIGGISLSEVTAPTIRRAHKVHPISAVEIELSLWSTVPFENGTVATCAELGIPIIAYSPLGRGFLTGQIRKYEDIPEDSFSKHLPRFQPAVFQENIKLLHAVEELAEKKGVSTVQIAMGWVLAQSGRNGNGVIIPIPGTTTSERVRQNTEAPAKLTEEDLAALDVILKKFPPIGNRYPDGLNDYSDA